jgi:predicted anti-sigma-YlaC factor YlaD
MECSYVKAELHAYVDGELSPERVARLKRHLDLCEDCREELANLKVVVEALETWPLAIEPSQLAKDIMIRVRSRPVLPRFRLHFSDLAISLTGSGLILAVILSLRTLYHSNSLRLLSMQLPLQVEMWWLEIQLEIQQLVGTGTAIWWPWPMFIGFAMVFTLTFGVLIKNLSRGAIKRPSTISTNGMGS